MFLFIVMFWVDVCNFVVLKFVGFVVVWLVNEFEGDMIFFGFFVLDFSLNI